MCRADVSRRAREHADAALLLARWQRQQFPPKRECAGRPLLVYVLSGAKGGVGLGCEFHGLALALAVAFRRERTLVLSRSRWWLAGRQGGGSAREDEGGRGWECREDAGDAAGGRSGFECFFEAVSACEEGDSLDVVEFTPGQNAVDEADKFWVPPEFRQHGLLWWRSQLAALLFRPVPSLVAQRRAAGDDAGDFFATFLREREYVGVHVRRGDKVSEVPLEPIESFAAAAAAVADVAATVQPTARLASSRYAADDDPPSSSGGDAGTPGGRGGKVPVVVVSDEESVAGAVLALLHRLQTQNASGVGAVWEGVRWGVAGVRREGEKALEEIPKSRSGHLVSAWNTARETETETETGTGTGTETDRETIKGMHRGAGERLCGDRHCVHDGSGDSRSVDALQGQSAGQL